MICSKIELLPVVRIKEYYILYIDYLLHYSADIS